MQLTALDMDIDTEKIDKIDMSLDDIIKLNKNLQKTEFFNMKAEISSSQQFRGYMGAGNMSGHEIKRRLYGKAGQAMHRMSSWNGVSPLKRPPLKVRNSVGLFRRRKYYSRPRNMWNKPVSSMQRYTFSGNYSQGSDFRRGLMRQQKDLRQATYLHRRGLKVQATMDEPEELLARSRTNQWRTSMDSSGILTVSIDNPSAVALPSTIGTRLPRPPLPFLLKKEDSEIKVPKGVPLDFDINSVAKQTGITLNDRFKILKEQRLSQSVGKGSRFVTVG